MQYAYTKLETQTKPPETQPMESHNKYTPEDQTPRVTWQWASTNRMFFIAWCIAFNSFHQLSLAHEAKINKITNAHTRWAFRSLTKLKPNMCSCRLTRKTHMEEMPQKSKKFDDLGHNSTSSPCARLMHTRIQAQV